MVLQIGHLWSSWLSAEVFIALNLFLGMLRANQALWRIKPGTLLCSCRRWLCLRRETPRLWKSTKKLDCMGRWWVGWKIILMFQEILPSTKEETNCWQCLYGFDFCYYSVAAFATGSVSLALVFVYVSERSLPPEKDYTSFYTDVMKLFVKTCLRITAILYLCSHSLF